MVGCYQFVIIKIIVVGMIIEVVFEIIMVWCFFGFIDVLIYLVLDIIFDYVFRLIGNIVLIFFQVIDSIFYGMCIFIQKERFIVWFVVLSYYIFDRWIYL